MTHIYTNTQRELLERVRFFLLFILFYFSGSEGDH